MRKLTHSEIAKRRAPNTNIPENDKIPVIVLVDNVRSLYNVGSIFRTSDGAMIRRLILTGFTPSPPRKEIEKTALGSTKSVSWEYVKNPHQAVDSLKKQGYKICSLELTDSSVPYFQIPLSVFPLCLIIGNEVTGVTKDLVAESDMAIEIPMYGIKQSLNVAVAYGVAIFEIARIWRDQSAR